MKKLVILCLVALMSFVACQKEEIKDVSNPITSTSSKTPIGTENDYLVFNSWDDVNQTLTELEDFDNRELDVWEQQFKGFISLRNFNNQIQDAYDKINSQQDEQAFWTNYQQYAVLVDGVIEAKLDLLIGKLLSTEGVIKVGGVLYKYMQDQRIINVLDGDYNKLSEAEKLTVSDPSKNIYVTRVITTIHSNSNDRTDTEERTAYDPGDLNNTSVGRKKLTATLKIEDAEVVLSGGYHRRAYQVSLRMRSWYRGMNFWGDKVWKDRDTKMAYEGYWCAQTSNNGVAYGGWVLNPPVNTTSFAPPILNDNDYTFTLQTGSSSTWPSSISIAPYQFCQGPQDISIVAWIENIGPCCNLADTSPDGTRWFSCTIFNP